jgi:drug/metabolite transporter (DMT)-like permease
MVGAFVLATGNAAEIATLAGAPGLMLAQVVLAALQFLMFMRLQHVAGPVYVSQTGYVATAVVLGFGTLMLGESYSPWVWGAAGIIVAGIALVNSGRRPW